MNARTVEAVRDTAPFRPFGCKVRGSWQTLLERDYFSLDQPEI
jgi:hypothetical protein